MAATWNMHRAWETGPFKTLEQDRANGLAILLCCCFACLDKKSQEAKKQSTRRKLHSFYEVKQEIGR